MDLKEMSSKIVQLNQEIAEMKDVTDKRLSVAEEKLSQAISGYETKAVNFEEKVESENFVHYLRTGEIKESAMEIKAAKGAFEGGFPASQVSNNLVAMELEKLSVMRKICNVQMISSDSYDVIIEENGGKATWGTPINKAPFVKKYIKTFELVAEPKATAKLIEDVKIDIERFMSEKIAESFALAEDEAFLKGTGNEMPTGLLNIANGKTSNSIEQITGDLNAETIFKIIDSIDSFYSKKLTFLMNNETENLIKKLKDENGRHLWNNRNCENEQNTILGIPVFISNFMPNPEKGKICLFFGNFEKAYQIVEKVGNYMMRDPYTERPFIKFYTSKKIGGDLVNGNAIKALKI